jgi:hypothetical protein
MIHLYGIMNTQALSYTLGLSHQEHSDKSLHRSHETIYLSFSGWHIEAALTSLYALEQVSRPPEQLWLLWRMASGKFQRGVSLGMLSDENIFLPLHLSAQGMATILTVEKPWRQRMNHTDFQRIGSCWSAGSDSSLISSSSFPFFPIFMSANITTTRNNSHKLLHLDSNHVMIQQCEESTKGRTNANYDRGVTDSRRSRQEAEAFRRNRQAPASTETVAWLQNQRIVAGQFYRTRHLSRKAEKHSGQIKKAEFTQPNSSSSHGAAFSLDNSSGPTRSICLVSILACFLVNFNRQTGLDRNAVVERAYLCTYTPHSSYDLSTRMSHASPYLFAPTLLSSSPIRLLS